MRCYVIATHISWFFSGLYIKDLSNMTPMPLCSRFDRSLSSFIKHSWCQKWLCIGLFTYKCLVFMIYRWIFKIHNTWILPICVHLCLSVELTIKVHSLSLHCAAGRLCDGLSFPCRPQDISYWAPPATLSSCWKNRRMLRRAWCCHRRAGSGSCRTCWLEKSTTDDGLTEEEWTC